MEKGFEVYNMIHVLAANKMLNIFSAWRGTGMGVTSGKTKNKFQLSSVHKIP